MGPTGLAAHAANKLIFTFGEGMYHAPHQAGPGAVHQNPLQMYFIQGKKQHLGRTAYATLPCSLRCWQACVGRRPCGALSGARGNSGAGGRVWAAAVLLLWETRSRYLMNFCPCFCWQPSPARRCPLTKPHTVR